MNVALKQILEQVEARAISPAEGQRRLRELRSDVPAATSSAGQPAPAPAEQPAAPAASVERPVPATADADISGVAAGTAAAQRDIAVVGLSCRFAGAADAAELWRMLAAGRCGVREVPPSRWDADALFDADPRTPGRTNCRHGGFLDDVDAFDPLFFNLSGHEAERMDPQQRIFLEGCWTALEDAGYCGDDVSGASCGVFAGAPASDYETDAQRGGLTDAQVLMGNDSAILPARISYLLNLRGPSLAVNTACSSSLVAVQLACRALACGECELALAGGVCLFVRPGFYLAASTADMLSPDGRCHAFDHRANGFVPGEGVGVVVLKTLEAALRDGDEIRGVISGIATNQDGKTNGITAPSSRSQTDVQLAAYELAEITADQISFVEAHGTGTALGDPIEIEALTRSFAASTDRTQFCAIGSIKTNIGHAGQAAGVAGLIKVLLAIEHETIPPTLHFERANSRIDFTKTPFRVVAEAEAWPRRPGAPRHAVVSSFGYSGTNAHVVVSEPPPRAAVAAAPEPQLALVSAKTEDALRQRLADLAAWLDAHGAQRSLADIAYTLQTGRKHFAWRAAFVSYSVAELRDAILRRVPEPTVRAARVPAAERRAIAQELLDDASPGGEGRAALLARAGTAYERGLDVDVRLTFDGRAGRRISLPTYPFARDRYWSDDAGPATEASPSAGCATASADPPAGASPPAALAATGAQTTALAGLRLETQPGGTRFAYRPPQDDPIVADHAVHGRPILAAMVALELGRAAGELAGRAPRGVRDLAWRRPLPSTESAGIDVTLVDDDGFEISQAGVSAGMPHVTGTLAGAGAGEPPILDADRIASRLPAELDGAECYRRFAELGFDYGPAFRVVQRIKAGDDEALAWLALPDHVAASVGAFGLHPLLLDGALQAMIALGRPGEDDGPRLPYALRSAALHAPPVAACVAHIRRDAEGLLDVDLAATDGRVLASLRGLAVADAQTGGRVSCLRPVWRQIEFPAAGPNAATRTLVLDRDDAVAARMRQRAPEADVVLALPGDSFRELGRDRFEVRPGATDDVRRLLAAARRPDRIVVRWGAQTAHNGASGLPDHRFGLYTLLALARALGEERTAGPTSIRFEHPLADDARVHPHLAALAAAARSASLEDPDLRIQVVGVAAGAPDGVAALPADIGPGDPVELRIAADGGVTSRSLEPVEPAPPARTAVRRGGAYVVTGGAGSVGRTLAGHLAAHGANVVLAGRSALDDDALLALAALAGTGEGSVVYRQADVADRGALAALLEDVRERVGPVRGIVHAAGVVRDAFLRDKRDEQVEEVLAGKVAGAVWLDELTRERELDFLAFCSSAVTVVGNVGQVDYAFANAVLDELAADREARRRAGGPHGRTVSIGWPAWAGSGMASGHAVASNGHALTAREALSLFDEALASDEPHLVAVRAEREELRSLVSANGESANRHGPAGNGAALDAGASDELRAAAESLLVDVLADELRVPPARIDPLEPLETYGIDSVMVMALSTRLERELGPLPKTLFYEYSTLGELAAYVAQRHADRLPARDSNGAAAPEATPAVAPAGRPQPDACRVPAGPEIAVIGISGRYPGANDLDAYWRNLACGHDCVSEIPADRWALEGFYDPSAAAGSSYSKWGGFLDGVDRFDPVFFGISPNEADMMDPQERLFLETVWHALEDAGYTRAGLRERETAVFVGVMYGHYQLYGPAPDGRLPMSSFASIANRVSYLFDFHGPSMALDTMCSSSLTAIHLACESLRRGECRAAVAGGVNLSLHPDKYRQLSLGGFASSDGRCRSFGDGGDGYVPGEGVGAVLLKPLADAVADGDHIHAVIRGSALNHGGKTNGYTVPNPRAQADAIAGAMRAGGVAAHEIDYVEAHGTGTSLGDPIEVAALTRAYGAPAGDRRIPIGSAKSSIGHLESAAGIAAITKVVLQLRHRMLPPTLHAEKLNPNIDFTDSPLAVQRELAAWEPGPGRTRLSAAVSSFGAGGSNAHVIVSEHEGAAPPDGEDDGAQVVVLSARSDGELRVLAGRVAQQLGETPPSGTADALRSGVSRRVCELLGVREEDLGPHDSLREAGLDEPARARLEGALCEDHGPAAADLPAGLDSVADVARAIAAPAGHEQLAPGGPAAPSRSPRLRLADVAFTLQTGREAMSHRLALVAGTSDDAGARLAAFAAGASTDAILTGVVRAGDEGQAGSPSGAEPDDVARRWVGGTPVDWHTLHAGRARHRVPLPGYPFARASHWLPSAQPQPPAGTATPDREEVEMIAEAQTTNHPPTPPDSAGLTARVERELIGFAAGVIGLQPDRLDPRVGLGDYGFDSLAFKALAERIAERYDIAFAPTVFYERAGVRGAAEWLVEEHGDRLQAAVVSSPAPGPSSYADEDAQTTRAPAVARHAGGDGHGAGAGAAPIAVIGMSGRFPGAPDLDGFWEHLAARRDLVTEIPPERWDWRELDNENLPPEERCRFRWGAFLDDVDTFDPLFFGISPAEAEMMDPQQRLLLLTAWAAIEDAGYRPSQLAGQPVGLFAGIQFHDYQHLLHEAGVLNAQAALGNEHSIAVNRISYLLDLHGPSEPVNTACSSSLVAVAHAVRSLRSGESSAALAGGIALNLASHSTEAAGMMGMLSPDGRCKTLDASANGYVKGEGVGLLLLKRLDRALADGDRVDAVIRGTSINHGGRASSLTAPNSTAQAALLRDAILEAGVGADTIGYLELHGTGTELGDPVEINGVKSAFRQLLGTNGASRPAQPYCGLGSVKTNVGHLEPASGIAGLMKTILAMRHEQLPGMVHLTQLNPYVELDGSPFFVVEDTIPWGRRTDGSGNEVPLRAGVSSFGFGGVNAHVLVEEHRNGGAAAPGPPCERAFLFSGRTPEALDEMVRRFAERIDAWDVAGTAPDLHDVSFTLQDGREELDERLAVVASDLAALRGRLAVTVDGGDPREGEGVHRGQSERGAAEPAGTGSLDELCAAWVRGAMVDWVPSRRGRAARRVSLPTYPFAKRRYWFTSPATPARRSVAQTASDHAGSAGTDTSELHGEPAVRAALRAILGDKLKLADDELDEDRELQDFGVDSIVSAMIVQVVQSELDVEIALTALVEHPTLRRLSRYIFDDCLDGVTPAGLGGGRAPATRSRDAAGGLPPELLPINTEGTRQRSFWVHGATGYSTWFQNLSEALGPEYPLYAFQAKGTDGYSMPQDLDEMVAHYVDCIRKVQPRGPYVIGGYSFGGLIAMEMARRLDEEGEEIRHLVMFDTYPAEQRVFDSHMGDYDDDFLPFYLINFFLRIDEHPERLIRPEELAHVPSELRLAQLARMARERGQKRISADDIYLYVRGGLTCSAHSEGIYQTYEMRPYTASDVLFFTATDGFTGRATAAFWPPTRILDWDYVEPWRDVVDGELHHVELDNDHLNMLEEPTLTAAAQQIEALLKDPPELDGDASERFAGDFAAVTSFGQSLLAHHCRASGALPAAGETATRDALRERLAVAPEYGRLFDASVDVLEREGFLERREDALAPTRRLLDLDLDEDAITARAEELAAEHGEAAVYLPLLTTAQAAVLDVMSGRRQATDVLFPGGSMDLVSELYAGNVQTDFYNRLVADRVLEHVRHFTRRYPRSAAQIFEIGAGTGATSEMVFEFLAGHADRIRYHFTDIGAAFLSVARAQFGAQVPYVEFAEHDVERTPQSQGWEPHSMDVAIASNVLHTTHRIDVTLAQSALLLKPGGLLVINELTQRLDYNTLTFGLTEGWWLYDDPEGRIPGSPLLTAAMWRDRLLAAGFHDIEVYGAPGVDDDDQAQCVIAATRVEPSVAP